MFVKECSHFMNNLMTHDQVILHFRTSQINVSVLQANVFIYIDSILNVEWRSLGFIQNAKFSYYNLNFACFHLRVDCIFASCSYFSLNCKNIFTAYGFSLMESFLTILWTHDQLYNPAAITKINKDQSAMISSCINPSS